MTENSDAAIDLGQLTGMPRATGLQVTQQDLRDALEANRRSSRPRRLSPAEHVELTIRYKDGEPGTVLAREYGVSQVSLRQAISRVQRAAEVLARKRLRGGPLQPELDTSSPAGGGSIRPKATVSFSPPKTSACSSLFRN